MPDSIAGNFSELFLVISYQGDVARLSSNNKLLDDNFFNGHSWRIGMSRFLSSQKTNSFELSILPLRKDAPVYFEPPSQFTFPPTGQIHHLDGLSLVPEYQLILSGPSSDRTIRH